MVNRIWHRARPTVCIPCAEGLFFADTVDGKLLRNRFFPAAPEEDRSALFLRAASQGFPGKQILLCAALPGLRLESRRFPDMTKEELAETMRWESDRIFRTDAPLSMDWTATAHEPDRWDILAAACTEEELRRWTEPAGQAGRRIVCAAVPLPRKEEEGLLFVRPKDLLLLRLTHGRAEKKRYAPEESASFRQFLADRHLLCFPVPAADCSAAHWEALTNAGFPLPSFHEALCTLALRLSEAPRLDLSFPEDRSLPLFSRSVLRLRAAQGLCLCAAAALLWSGIACADSLASLSAETDRMAALSGARQAMADARKAQAVEEAARQENREFIRTDPAWETKLVALAELLPPGVTLRDITSRDGAIRLAGASADSRAVSVFQSRLSAAWELPCRVESLRRDAPLPFYRFAISCEPEKGASS